MTRRRKGTVRVGTITPEQIYGMRQGRFLPTSGFGVHGDTSYNRRKEKAAVRRLVREELDG